MEKCNFHYLAMFIMAWQILESADLMKTQTFQYLEDEALFFLQIKKFINCILRATLWQTIVIRWRFLFHKGSFRSEMEKTPFRCLFWNANYSVVKLKVCKCRFFVIQTLLLKVCEIMTTTTNVENFC